MSRSAYEIISQDDATLTIRDTGGGRLLTVTNDAEAVVAELHRSGRLGIRKLLYWDSEGSLDEIHHDGRGGFTGFGCGCGS